MLSLGNGQPNPSCFPFASLSVTTKPGPDGETHTFELGGGEMDDALQYGARAPCMPARTAWPTSCLTRLVALPADGAVQRTQSGRLRCGPSSPT